MVWVQQPCSHPVQLHGMCGICGADLTTYVVVDWPALADVGRDDYLSPQTSAPDDQAGPSRFPGAFELAHDALGVTVSMNACPAMQYVKTADVNLDRKHGD